MFNLNHFELYRRNSTDHGLHTDYRFQYALPFESVDHPVEITLFLQRNWQQSITVSVVYFIMIKLLQMMMTHREAFRLRNSLCLWNGTLALFSIVGFIRFSEDFFDVLYRYGLAKSICYSTHPNDVGSYWAMCFLVSKLVEMGDTLFIVLRKKPLIFLHYYHHAAVLVYTAHSGAEHTAAGRWFIWMNFLAHSFMYTYYAMKTYGLKLPKTVPIIVTTVQTMQMLTGMLISVLVYKIKSAFIPRPCQQSFHNLYLALIIYTTFAFLFIRFFFKRYYLVKDKKRKEQ